VDLSSERAPLGEAFAGADAVVHLAWAFQPTHDPATTWRTNVLGSMRVFDAVAAAGVPALLHASSVGAYSPGPKDHAVDESWPTHGWPDAAYCREKAYLERALDTFERDHPAPRVVRMPPALLLQPSPALSGPARWPGRTCCRSCRTSRGCACSCCTPTTRRTPTGWRCCPRRPAARSTWPRTRRSTRSCSAGCWAPAGSGCRGPRPARRSPPPGGCICCPPHLTCSTPYCGCL